MLCFGSSRGSSHLPPSPSRPQERCVYERLVDDHGDRVYSGHFQHTDLFGQMWSHFEPKMKPGDLLLPISIGV